MSSRHLLDCGSLTNDWVETLFSDARRLKKNILLKNKTTQVLQGYHVGLLFYEPSTRTRASFHIASKILGANPVTIEIASSSVQKGESFEDTVMTLEAMGCHFLVVRHSESLASLRAIRCAKSAHVINAGDGTNQHPTQALLDTFTILENKGSLQNLNILFLGDILHSRVARSNFLLLKTLGVKNLCVCGPQSLMPSEKELGGLGVRFIPNINEALSCADVINVLRIQLERHSRRLAMTRAEYRESYGLTANRLQERCKKDVLVMHPGPMSVGVEIDREVADGPNSLILRQVQNGVVIRMAVLLALHKTC